MKRGNTLKVTIDRLDADGCGVASADGRDVFVRGGLPGDTLEIRLLSVKRHYVKAAAVSLESTETQRIMPECPHFGVCGGCIWQDIPYETQCGFKRNIIKNTLTGLYGDDITDGLKIVPSPDIFFYRNKMEFSFDINPGAEKNYVLGLHQRGKFDRVFDLKRCFLQSEFSNRIVETMRMFIDDYGLEAYGLRNHRGLLRFLVVREGKKTGDIMVNLVTSADEFDCKDRFAEYLMRQIQPVSTVIRTLNSGQGSVVTGESRETLAGDGNISEIIGDYKFSVSPDSFFQTNTKQTENLYDAIKRFARLDGGEKVLDLYCGTGTIGIYLSRDVSHVTGIELVEPAVKDAFYNAEINGTGNLDFIAGAAEKVLESVDTDFDVVICDPPRAGIHPKAMYSLITKRIPRLVYVSCSVKSLARDSELLLAAGYRVKDMGVFDMSPHTPNIETIVSFEIE